ncbi:alkaline phosphatase family protein [Rothia nasisuis]|uniref:alkaline phosphatase family protein n=1 Tax=Rothia nasisuis TaxID=2109647 RepID=UPI001F317822|nr:alkaline phosphatase family protein [Rothia nasisuis]
MEPLTDFCGSALPAPASYGNNSVADLFEACGTLAAQSSLTPDPHPLHGPGRHDLLHLANRISEAGADPSRYRSVCLVMVDGLGQALLNCYGSYAPFLKKATSLGPLDAAMPSTTVASLTSLGTATAPGYHGMAGYEVRNPDSGEVMNQLSGWDKHVDPRSWQPIPTVFERFENHLDVVTVSLGKYAGTGLSEASLRGGRFVHASTYAARTTLAASLLNSRKPSLVYLYWGELDQAGHKYGAGSKQWLWQLEELDLALKSLVRRLPPHVLLLVTADHGMVNIAAENRIDYSGDRTLLENVELTAGEPRMVQLYLKDCGQGAKEDALGRWGETWGEQAWVIDTEYLYENGYFGPVISDTARARIGDIIVATREPIALYDMRHYKPQALNMVGQHGSLTSEETQVPLLMLPTG